MKEKLTKILAYVLIPYLFELALVGGVIIITSFLCWEIPDFSTLFTEKGLGVIIRGSVMVNTIWSFILYKND